MPEPIAKRSINQHFRREGVLQATLILAIVGAAAVLAFVAPWFFQQLQ